MITIINNGILAVDIPRGGSCFHCLHWNLECLFLRREGNWKTRRKTLGAKKRTNIKLNPHVKYKFTIIFFSHNTTLMIY